MPDRPGRSRLLGALSAGLLAALLLAPAAVAQTEPVPPPSSAPPPTQPSSPPSSEAPEQHPPGSWGGSSFESPFDEPDPLVRRDTFDIAGTLRYEKTSPAEYVRDVEVRVVDDPADSFTPVGDCPLPDPVAFVQERPQTEGFTAEHAFLVEAATVPCNGRYLVQAEGRLEDPAAPSHTLEQSFVVAAMPPAVTGLGVTVDSQARSVTATFKALDEADLAPDALGYVLERSSPTSSTFVDVATIDADDPPKFVDPLTGVPAGSYTYRVRAVRAGVEGDVRSSVIDTETDTVEVTGEPRPTAGVTGAKSSRVGGARSSGGRLSAPRTGTSGRLSPPTTLDTGFDDSLDYGDEPGSERTFRTDGDDPLAGQSIVQDEADGMGLAAPAAGALVMLGWAGHILYLNRLAKQL